MSKCGTAYQYKNILDVLPMFCLLTTIALDVILLTYKIKSFKKNRRLFKIYLTL